jgi:hypothetical protein
MEVRPYKKRSPRSLSSPTFESETKAWVLMQRMETPSIWAAQTSAQPGLHRYHSRVHMGIEVIVMLDLYAISARD